MSTCIKDLYDYDMVKNCSKCGLISLKSRFYKKSISKDRLDLQCISCFKKNYSNNLEKTKEDYLDNRIRMKDYYSENYDKIIARQKIYFNNGYNSDINLHLIHLT